MFWRRIGAVRALVAALGGVLCLAGCAPRSAGGPPPTPQPATAPAAPGPTRTPFQPILETPGGGGEPRATEPASGASPGLSLWVAPALPRALRDSLALPDFLAAAPGPEAAHLRVEPGEGVTLSRWVYALVAPFPTRRDGVSSDALRRAWSGEGEGPFGNAPLLVSMATRDAFTALWGPPGDGQVAVHPAEQLLERAWASRPSWALVPFEALSPRWKVLSVDGQSPIHKGFFPEGYPLTVPVSLRGPAALVDTLVTLHGPGSAAPLLPPDNHDPGRMTVVALTGVTALVRATAWTMEVQGVTYPARDVGAWLREADVTHISNEVPFAPGCPAPDPVQQELRFCSDPRYAALLDEVGTDVVELTGDHFQDWGTEAMMYTLELYRERGWPVYGGGENLEAAQRPVVLEHNGNRVAFLGCNAKGRPFAGAGASTPGAAPCDFARMRLQVEEQRAAGAVPIVTFQHFEYYTYAAPPNMQADFQAMAEAGAAVVSGSQAHHPHGLAFHEGALLHYGLGNLFFDQLDVSPGTRLAFIDRHVIYGGRHISTELLPIVFVDYARARPATPAEGDALLRDVFAASGW